MISEEETKVEMKKFRERGGGMGCATFTVGYIWDGFGGKDKGVELLEKGRAKRGGGA